jgi:hypothetical protein
MTKWVEIMRMSDCYIGKGKKIVTGTLFIQEKVDNFFLNVFQLLSLFSVRA